ncbi:hypothetical protein QBC43DRAFT_142651 [Cladorrhinum sp. PSN259]|nr:hypothetical protein QBC43DRAFT_142651 [Cladorrhinum sp. PSN259]
MHASRRPKLHQIEENKRQRRYLDFFVTVTSRHTPIWNDAGSRAYTDGAFWLACPQGNPHMPRDMELRPLGGTVTNHYGDLNNTWGTLLLGSARSGPQGSSWESSSLWESLRDVSDRVRLGPPPVAEPVDYELLWSDTGSGAKEDVSVWRPVAPDGYVALGDVAWSGKSRPALREVWCLRDDLVGQGVFREVPTWTTEGFELKAAAASFWDVIPAAAGSYFRPGRSESTNSIPTHASTFRFSNGSFSKPDNSLAVVPLLFIEPTIRDEDVSATNLTFNTNSLPKENYKSKTVRIRSITLPYTAATEGNDPTCLASIDPFVVVSKTTHWHLICRQFNDTHSPVSITIIRPGSLKTVKPSSNTNIGVHLSLGSNVFTRWGVLLNHLVSFEKKNTKRKHKKRRVKMTQAWEVPPKHVSLIWVKVTKIRCQRKADGSEISEALAVKEEMDIVDLAIPRGF